MYIYIHTSTDDYISYNYYYYDFLLNKILLGIIYHYSTYPNRGSIPIAITNITISLQNYHDSANADYTSDTLSQ